ncbi:MAG: hypothetical protein RSF79_08915 [Janthinobacterium sp.]
MQQMPASNTAPARAATARFDKLGDIAKRMAIVHAAVARYGTDLKARFTTLAMVSAGYRARRDASGDYALHAEPCVVCTVTNKWNEHAAGQAPDGAPLPKHLLVRYGARGRALDYAVPVDVQSLQWFSGLEAQRNNGIVVDAPSGPSHGAITCAIRLQSAQGGQWYALSALHVLTPTPPLDVQPVPGLGFAAPGEPGRVGTSSAYSGVLRQGGISFDAQLAYIDTAWFNAAFSGAALGHCPPLRGRAELDALADRSRFVILAPANDAALGDAPRAPILAQFSHYADGHLPIRYDVTRHGISFSTDVYLAELIVLAAGRNQAVSRQGDSGSPVIAIDKERAVFVGMLIGGPAPDSATDRMVVLPSWQLLDLDNWASLPAGTRSLNPAFLMQ